MFFARLVTLLVSVPPISAARLVVSVPPSPPQLPNPATLPSSTHAVLLGPPGVRYDVTIRRDNSFLFEGLSEASYLLTIHSRDLFFPPLRVDVNKAEGTEQNINVWQTFRGNEWSNKGPSYGEGKDELVIQVRPSTGKNFYQERGGFSLIGFVKSPMILMALVSVAMIFGLPYLMENMDPEMKAEMEDLQRKGPVMGAEGAASQIQNFDLAGWMAGKSSGSGGGGSSKKR